MLIATLAAHPAVMEAEEVQTLASLPQVHDPGLGLLERKAHLGQDRPKRHKRRLGLPSVVAEHQQVIRETHQNASPALRPLPVEPMQVELHRQGEITPPCGVPVSSRRTAPSSITPARNIARRSFSRCRSLIRSSTAAINPECGISPKQLAMSVSAAHRLPLQDSSISTWSASCCDRLGRNPNEHGKKSASKIGSMTIRVAA